MKIISPKSLLTNVFQTVRNGDIFANSSLDLPFARTKTLDPRVTFTRASSGTYVGSDGLIKTATTNEARFDHNPTTGESLGLLVEEARTNLALRSEELNVSPWSALRSTITSNDAIAPNGTLTAEKLTEDTLLLSKLVQQTLTGTAGTTYVFSAYVKAAGRTQAALRFTSGAGILPSTDMSVIYSLINGSEILKSSANINSFPSVPLSNGWFRLIVSTTLTGAGNFNCILLPTVAGSTAYTGDGASGIYLWGAQLEAGAFPTSYIPTTSATVTRAADVASITGSNFSSFYRQDEGTVFTEYRDPGVSGTNRYASLLSDGTNSNRIGSFVSSTTTINSRHVVGNTQTNPGTLNTVLNSRNRHAIAAAIGSCNAASNGTLATASAPASMPNLSQLTIGAGINSTEILNAPVARITFWPTRLANTTLQQITS